MTSPSRHDSPDAMAPAQTSMRFMIACGGTGGHLSPGIAVAEALTARGHEAMLLISEKQVDRRLSAKYPSLRFERIPGAPFSWSPREHLRFHWRQWRGLATSVGLVRGWKPDAVIGFGGFTNTSVVVAAWLHGLPIALHEANRVPGRAIRVLSRFANRLYLPPGVRLPGRLGVIVRHTGLPVRGDIQRVSRRDARERLGVHPNQRLLFVVGGSQGAAPLNRWVDENLPALATSGVQVWCLTGMGGRAAEVRTRADRNGEPVRAWFEPFSDRMGELISAADLVVSRAGAGTLSELVRCETPGVLVPYPFAADNHQMANARYFEQQGGGVVVDQAALGSLRDEVLETIFNDWLLNKFRENLRRMAQEDCMRTIVQDLETLARREPPVRHLRHAAPAEA